MASSTLRRWYDDAGRISEDDSRSLFSGQIISLSWNPCPGQVILDFEFTDRKLGVWHDDCNSQVNFEYKFQKLTISYMNKAAGILTPLYSDTQHWTDKVRHGSWDSRDAARYPQVLTLLSSGIEIRQWGCVVLRSQRPGQQGLAVGHRRARRPEPTGHVSSHHGIC